MSITVKTSTTTWMLAASMLMLVCAGSSADDLRPKKQDRQSFTVLVGSKIRLSEVYTPSASSNSTADSSRSAELQLDTTALVAIRITSSGTSRLNRAGGTSSFLLSPGRTTIRIRSSGVTTARNDTLSRRLLHVDLPSSEHAVLTIAEP